MYKYLGRKLENEGVCIDTIALLAFEGVKQSGDSEIIREFIPRKHPIIGKLLAREGPKNLLDIAVEKGYKPQEEYADKCHLCFSTRNFLRPFYPNILEPSNLYL